LSKATTNLGLFEYESTDDTSTFNIDSALNENWVKVDAGIKANTDALVLVSESVEESKIFQDDSNATKYEFGFNNGQLYYRVVV